MSKTETTYRDAGVNIDAGARFARTIKELTDQHWPGLDLDLFAGGGNIPAGAKQFRGCVDGAGTKAFLAQILGKLDTIGIDAVAMSTVDKYMDGTRPAALFDYLVLESLRPDKHIEIIKGVIEGCLRSGCFLAGGETAEHPGVGLPKGYFDIATFCVGFPDPSLELNPKKNIVPGMKLLGWKSYGLGSNGYSLARKVFALRHQDGGPDKVRGRLEGYYNQLDNFLGQCLLRPTAIYISEIEELRNLGIKFIGHAHITGGGLRENPPRIMPANCVAEIKLGSWDIPPIFSLIESRGNVEKNEMFRTFNMGLQMISVVADGTECNHPNCVPIGRVRERMGEEPQVAFN